MLKKNIKYTDFNGNQVSEDYYFNLTKAELTEMEMSIQGGFSTHLEHVMNTRDMPALMDFFKLFIVKSYGEKSADGKYFRKDGNMAHDFTCSAAYDSLFNELLEVDGDTSNLLKFIAAVVPPDISEKVLESATKVRGEGQSAAAPVLVAGA